MGLVGADVDQMRTLARTLGQAADRLESMAGDITARLSSAPWSGPDAEGYRSWWNGESQALIRGVAVALRDAAGSVERNAAEQDQASAGNGTGSLAMESARAPMSTGGMMADLNGTEANPFVSIRDFLNSNAVWPVTWSTALDNTTGLGPVLPLLDALGLANDSSLSPEDKIIQAGNSMTDLAGGLLKERGGAIGYLSGVAVTQWGDVAAQVAQADFRPEAVKATVDYIASDPAGAFDAARDAVLGYVPKLFSNLLP